LAEFILRRKLTDRTWQAYMTSESRKRRNTNDKVYSVKYLFTEPRERESLSLVLQMLPNMPQRK